MGCPSIEKKPVVIAVCGEKNSGKTSLLVKLVREFSRRGIKTAVIKHDGHDFTCDIPGTDSYRLKQAGAYGTAVFSDSRIFVHKTGTKEREGDLIQLFPEAQLVFFEGMKKSCYPKIEVIREGISKAPVSNPQGRFLIVTDKNPSDFAEKTVGFDDIGMIVDSIIERMNEETKERNDNKCER